MLQTSAAPEAAARLADQPPRRPAAVALPATPYTAFKALFDRACAILILIVASPVILVVMLVVKLSSAGPAIYSQTRLGKNGKPFTIYKIRTMANNCERHSGVRWSNPGDTRVTGFGRFLRAAHLDELPQLWNVIRGDMSLVGPRPERPEFVPQLERHIPQYRDRLLVNPGLTGLAQVNLPPDTDITGVARKLGYDLYYLRNLTFGLDVRLVVCTAIHALGLPFRIVAPLCGVPGRLEVEAAER